MIHPQCIARYTLLALCLSWPAQAQPDPAAQCAAAIQAAETQHTLPPALLGAIARVESGRRAPSGALAPWPWTINAEGQGRYFESKPAAIAAVEALRARGVRLIDVGCLQVNLHFHPTAFATLEDAFDPAANAHYAGGLLRRLYAAAQDWVVAAGHYHSQTPERAEGYRRRVLAAWPDMPLRQAEERQRLVLQAALTGGARAVALAVAQRPIPPALATHSASTAPRRVVLLSASEPRR